MPDAVRRLNLEHILPIVIVEEQQRALPVARALQAGGLSAVEVTMRTPVALNSIEKIARQIPEIEVGAGTVLNVRMAQDAMSAGAKFIVSPGLSKNVVTWCLERQIPVYPGVSTPTEIVRALELGIEEMKFFPAEQAGGVQMLKTLASPFRTVRFIPTGGIGIRNLKEYLKLSNVIACGGSWLCSEKLIQAGAYEQITALCREAVEAAVSCRTSGGISVS